MTCKKILRDFRGFQAELKEADLYEKVAAVDTDLFSA